MLLPVEIIWREMSWGNTHLQLLISMRCRYRINIIKITDGLSPPLMRHCAAKYVWLINAIFQPSGLGWLKDGSSTSVFGIPNRTFQFVFKWWLFSFGNWLRTYQHAQTDTIMFNGLIYTSNSIVYDRICHTLLISEG